MKNEQTILTTSIFARRPHAEALPVGIPVWRAPSKGSAGCIILSKDVLGCWTHFFRGRTQPCMGELCTICPQENERRWHGYVVGWGAKSRLKCIVEVGPGPSEQLASFADERGSLRGVGITLSRRNGKPNGPVFIVLQPNACDLSLLPECPALEPLLLRMWHVVKQSDLIDIFDEPKVYNADDHLGEQSEYA